MSVLERIRGIYFSSHHFTRDLIGTVAPLTAFALGAMIAYETPRETAVFIFQQYLVNLTFWALIFALTVYLIGGYFIGTFVAFAGSLVHRTFQRLPRIGQKYSYTYWYNKDASDIDAFYAKHIDEHDFLTAGAAVTPTDKVNVLKLYFRPHNPEAYSEAYRQFMKVDIVRAALFYSIVIAAHEGYRAWRHDVIDWPIILAVSAIICISLVELPRRIRKVVRTEYQFLIATSQIVYEATKPRP